MEKIQFEVKDNGVKCDSCGYVDEDARWSDPEKVFKKWTGKKCPICGRVMITKECEKALRAQLSMIEFTQIMQKENS